MADPITGAIVVYDDSDNQTRLQLRVDGSAIADHSLITRAVLSFGALDIDSDITGSIFDLTQTSYLGVKLGGSSLRKGQHYVRVKTFDPANPGGVVWDDRLPVVVR